MAVKARVLAQSTRMKIRETGIDFVETPALDTLEDFGAHVRRLTTHVCWAHQVITGMPRVRASTRRVKMSSMMAKPRLSIRGQEV
jgi:hypothetical protein